MTLSGTGHYLLLGEEEGGGIGLCVGEYLISPKDSVIFLCSLLYSPPLKILLATTDPPLRSPLKPCDPRKSSEHPYPTSLSNE